MKKGEEVEDQGEEGGLRIEESGAYHSEAEATNCVSFLPNSAMHNIDTNTRTWGKKRTFGNEDVLGPLPLLTVDVSITKVDDGI